MTCNASVSFIDEPPTISWCSRRRASLRVRRCFSSHDAPYHSSILVWFDGNVFLRKESWFVETLFDVCLCASFFCSGGVEREVRELTPLWCTSPLIVLRTSCESFHTTAGFSLTSSFLIIILRACCEIMHGSPVWRWLTAVSWTFHLHIIELIVPTATFKGLLQRSVACFFFFSFPFWMMLSWEL